MIRRLPRPAVAVSVVFSAVLAACGGSGSRALPAVTAVPIQTSLDSVFQSPLGQYTIRYNHAWPVRQVPSAAGLLDLFTLGDATFSVTSSRVPPGTPLDTFMQATFDQYRGVRLRGLERAGSIDIGGGKGEVLRATTYVTAQGATVADPPVPGATPRNLYQALYVAGDQSFTFSIAWPQDGHADFVGLFRSLLQTFTLAGAS